MARYAALGAGHHQVLDAHVGESAARHHAVVAPARAVAVEVGLLDPVPDEVTARRRVRLDRAGRRNVVGRHRVAEHSQRSCADDLANRTGLHPEAVEERRLLNVRARLIPLVGVADARRDFVPLRILIGKVAVQFAEYLRLERALHEVAHLSEAWPKVAQEHVRAVVRLAKRFARQVDVDPPGQRERHDERRRHQEIAAHVLVHARLEVAVAGEHRGDNEVVVEDRLLDLGVERAGVADAGCAAIANEVEAKPVEVWLQAGLVEIIAHHARTRRERSLDQRRQLEAALDRALGQEPGGQHHAGVGGVRATRDRGDDHVTVAKRLGAVTVHRHIGRDLGQVATVPPEAAVGDRLGKERLKLPAKAGHLDAILRPSRPGHTGLDGAQVERQFHRVIDLALARDAEQPLCAVVILVRRTMVVGTAGGPEVVHRLLVDREKTHRRAVLRRHVGDRGAVGQRQLPCAVAVKLNKLPDHLGLAQHLGNGQRKVGRGDALAQCAVKPHADHVRRQEVDRLTQHPGLGLDAADAPADDAQPVDHRRVRIGADERVRIINAIRAAQYAAREILEIHLVHNADSRRHHLERIERLHAPLQKLVPLSVARELHLEVFVHRILRAGEIDLHRVVNHQVHRHQRLDDLRIPAEPRCRRAHRCQVDQQRHAGEILQHNPRDSERDLLRSRGLGLPTGELADVFLRHLLPVAMAQHRFQDQSDADRQPRNIPHAGLGQRRQ